MKTPHRPKGQASVNRIGSFQSLFHPHLKMTDLNIEHNHRKQEGTRNEETTSFLYRKQRLSCITN